MGSRVAEETVYGIARTTFDTDLLTTDRAALQPDFWAAFANVPDVPRGACRA